ncbi:NAD-dependent epimerase/dehydratase family protein [Xanthomonas maliensis]|uniref:NAD-dependent epimerase/dehydratase family protein n=2 Tax=Xanthomonas maliensis TaxID=1321368 RepID=UPI0012646D52|nr:NAD-dependent epimerase/dehydratase family protein [Xanthomonas maliensis]KAB7765819.1 GDP-mannose 4,6 dehydratase [Xanthomonas maliensis]
MTPTAIVTGVDGFTGPYMAEELQRRGYRVHGLRRSGGSTADVTAVDLLDRPRLGEVVERIRPEIVVHLAGISHVAHQDISAIYQTNVVGTRNLLDALSQLKQAPSSVLIASSAHVYGPSSHTLLTEQSPMAPFNDYAVSKVAAEYVAQLYMDRLPIVLTRPFNYIGIGQAPSFFVSKLVDHARRGELVVRLGNLDVERDFTDVRDLVACYGLLIARKLGGETVNICSGRSTSLRAVIELVENISGVSFQIQSDAEFMRINEVNRLAGSNEHLLALTGEVSFRPLRDTLEWMLSAP